MGKRVGVDIGGTFTDLVWFDEDNEGAVGAAKTLTTPHALSEGVLTALSEAAADDVSFLVHGTTIIINALTERKGARTALLTTNGFRDVLEIGRANRPDLYNFQYKKPRPFVPRRLRLPVIERLDFRGEVITPLDEQSVRDAVTEARRLGAEAIAICFLHAYASARHERAAAEIVRQEWPEVEITVSHEVTGEWREYERSSTTVLDAYVKPVASRYVAELEGELDRRSIARESRYFMRSNGGVATFDRAARVPIALVESGPVGGVIGALAVAEVAGIANVITLDIGGTTAKSSVIENYDLRVDTDYYIERTPSYAGYPIKTPVVDIVEIGAGGGSIAWIDDGGRLHIGPESAGATPGPACYGKGGTRPTLTDANVVAGRIDPGAFLGGRMGLDVALAETAIATIAEQMGRGVSETANGIVRVANANMIRLLKLVSVRRGRDPRDFAIVAYGGGGPVHATALARELRIPKVVVPNYPGHFSAWGMLTSDLRHDVLQTRVTRLEDDRRDELLTAWGDLEAGMDDFFEEEHMPPDRRVYVRSADMRYRGQEHTVNVVVTSGSLNETDLAEMARRFHDLHEQLYTFRQDSEIEIVNFRMTGFGRVPKLNVRTSATAGSGTPQPLGTRVVDFDDLGAQEATVYDRSGLPAGTQLEGPLVVQEAATSTVVFPDQHVEVDVFGNLIVHLHG